MWEGVGRTRIAHDSALNYRVLTKVLVLKSCLTDLPATEEQLFSSVPFLPPCPRIVLTVTRTVRKMDFGNRKKLCLFHRSILSLHYGVLGAKLKLA